MAITAEELNILIAANNEASEVFREVRSDFTQMSKDLARTGRTLTRTLTLPILAAGAGLFKLASDATEGENLFTVAMEDMSDAAREFSVEMREQLGLNDFEIRQQVASLFLMTTSMGVARESAFEMSTELVKLTFDLASLRNLKFEDAFEKIRSGIVGEAEPLKAIGILVNEASTRQALLNANLIRGSEVLTDQQKIMGRYQAIMQQTIKDQGDLARTIESPTNQLKIQLAQFKLLATEIGIELLPVYGDLLDIGNEVLEWAKEAAASFSDMSDEEQLSVLKTVALVAALGPLAIVLSAVSRLFIGLGTAIMFANEQLVLFRAATAAEKTLILAIAAAVIFAADQWIKLGKAAREAKRAMQEANEANELATASGVELADLWNAKIQTLKETNNELFQEFSALRQEFVAQGVDSIRAVAKAWRELGIQGRLAAEEAGPAIVTALTEAERKALEFSRTIQEMGEEMKANFETAQEMERVFGDSFDLTAENASIARSAIEEFIETGADLNTVVSENGFTLRQLVNWYNHLTASTEEAAEAQKLFDTTTSTALRLLRQIETPLQEYNRLMSEARAIHEQQPFLFTAEDLATLSALLKQNLADAFEPVKRDMLITGEDITRSLVSGMIQGLRSGDVGTALENAALRLVETYLVAIITNTLFPGAGVIAGAVTTSVGGGGTGGGSPAPASTGSSPPTALPPGTNSVQINQYINAGFRTRGEELNAGRAARQAGDDARVGVI